MQIETTALTLSILFCSLMAIIFGVIPIAVFLLLLSVFTHVVAPPYDSAKKAMEMMINYQMNNDKEFNDYMIKNKHKWDSFGIKITPTHS